MSSSEYSEKSNTVILNSAGSEEYRDRIDLVNVVIADGAAEIGKAAFAGCERLAIINIPDSVTEIGEGVFDGCTNLTNITIPDSVSEIGEGAFWLQRT